ncbi:hypothetical protein VTN00DRAFT_5454 [Thermoascus crustaceus]|uniref:uncharacterized protein n=1 Tax=Thermoascus crustaceus TaxID=5088 RepID=UPI003743F808
MEKNKKLQTQKRRNMRNYPYSQKKRCSILASVVSCEYPEVHNIVMLIGRDADLLWEFLSLNLFSSPKTNQMGAKDEAGRPRVAKGGK